MGTVSIALFENGSSAFHIILKMKVILFSLLCVLMFVHLEASEVEEESPRSIYVDVDGNDPRIKDFAEFAAEEMGYKLVSVGRVGKKTVRFNNRTE